MRRLTLILVCWIFLLLSSGNAVFAQHKVLNIPAIHQLVEESKSENKRQTEARNRQAAALANEQANLTLLAKLKVTYRNLQDRYNALGTAINAAQIGLYATPMVQRIISNQAQIVSYVEKNPALIAIGYGAALNFSEKAKDLLGYVSGLTLSIGDVNQMKASDRKLLFDYALSELSAIQDQSGNMLAMMQYSRLSDLLKATNPFQSFIDADQDLAKDILRNAKYLKP
ncbi:hypothetical protein SAMN05192574_105305 [Mucilaginibacter gossypiicola]|uniref:Uncharacterized protein n=1 Tax=Mucilaginibacter gossypiicola TaxID=551995 RepID=A0A1H8LZ39_9SPHI|nr:hypothetical protein [Mucilaginibacter gossypiicola]SEO10136.1 hypothetical protein SAMN05192574_105305 [Mucilaginibacter gossypiicola]